MKPRRLCTAALMMALATPGHAQGNPPTIPTALAAAVVGGFEMLGLSPHFVVGRAPADLPRALLPGAPWKIVGGVEMGPTRTLVLDAPRNRDAMADYLSFLARAGLKEVDFAAEAGGFVDRPRLHIYCDDSVSVTVMPGDSTATPRSLVVGWSRGPSSRACGVTRMDRRMRPLVIPPLRAPTGVIAEVRGTGWSSDNGEQTARVDTTLSVTALLDHYARQLGSAGWTIADRPVVAGGVGLQRLATRDKQGEEWQGALIIITVGAQRELTLRMAKSTPDRMR
jgi:hypothetical protein